MAYWTEKLRAIWRPRSAHEYSPPLEYVREIAQIITLREMDLAEYRQWSLEIARYELARQKAERTCCSHPCS